jgi:hypothetical protein
LGTDMGNGGVIGWASLCIGLAACAQRDLSRAKASLLDAWGAFEQRSMRWFMARCIVELGAVACGQGQAERAAGIIGAAEVFLDRIEAPLPRAERIHGDRIIAAAQAALGVDAFSVTRAAGRAMPLAEAVGSEPTAK